MLVWGPLVDFITEGQGDMGIVTVKLSINSVSDTTSRSLYVYVSVEDTGVQFQESYS